MRIYVCIKQVPDTETRIKISEDKSNIDENGIKWVISPYDEYAIEAAVQFKEKNPETKVTLITLGPKARTISSARTGMAMGADDTILIDSDFQLDPLTTAKALAKTISTEGEYKAIFTGKMAIDGSSSAVSAMLAELLSIPHVNVVSSLVTEGDTWKLTRNIEGGTKQTFEVKTPLLMGATKGLNKPRFASLPGIMKAKKKPVKEIPISELGISEADVRIKLTNFRTPPEKPPCIMIEGDADAQVAEVVKKLREEAKVL